jgi:hypothetical protein
VAASVITLSPHWKLDNAARQVRDRVARDGRASVTAATDDRRQVRQLRRLSHLLAAGDDLDCTLGDRPDGVTCLTAFQRGNEKARRGLVSWGDPKTVSDPGGPYLP